MVRLSSLCFLGTLLATVSLCGAQTPIEIAWPGTARLTETVKGVRVDVTFNTVTIDRSNPLFPYPMDGWHPDFIGVVRAIEISVDGQPIYLPPSVFGTLQAPNRASLRSEKGDFVLEITGGDAGLTTVTRIYFDKKGLKRLVECDAFDEGRPLWEMRFKSYPPPKNQFE